MTTIDPRSDEAWYRQTQSLVEMLRGDREGVETLGLDGYEDVIEIRRGAQGTVFSATRTGAAGSADAGGAGERVAIKVLHADVSERSRLRFLREIELVGQLKHPNIVTAIDQGRTADDRPYFVMPYVAGLPLTEYVATQFGDAASPTTVVSRLDLFRRICAAVSHAHQRGVIHRDLKPSNIRIDESGQPHVVDFGLARTEGVPGSSARDLTLETQFLGTLAYAAPEQAAGDAGGIDTRTDVYALGVILYEMLAGELPYDTSGSFSAALRAIEQAEPRRLARGGESAVDRGLEAIVLKSIKKSPDDRYQSVDALSGDVARYVRGDPIEARPETTWSNLRKLVRRHRVASALALTAAALVITLAVVSTVAVYLINAERREAQAEALKVQRLVGFYESIFASVRPDQAGRDVLVVDILDDASRRLDEEMTGAPDVAGLLHLTLGQTYRHLGRPDDAILHLERAIELETAADADPLEVLATQGRLAGALADFGRFEEADATATAALRDLRELPDAPPLLEAGLLEAQGGAAVARSDYAAAEPAFETGLRLKRQTNPARLELALSLNNLGMVKEHLAKYDAAAELYEEGIELMAGDEPEAVYARSALTHNLANLQSKLGRLEQAADLFRQSYDMTRALYGPRHPAVASTLETLGATLTDLGEFDEAQTLLEESLSIRRERLPAGHLKIASTLATLGELRLAEERPEESEQLMRQTRAMRAAQLGETHWLTAKADARISLALLHQGRFADAHRLAVDAYEHMLADGGVQRAARLGVVDMLCELYERWPEPDPGASTLMQSLAEQLRSMPEHAALADRVDSCLELLSSRAGGS